MKQKTIGNDRTRYELTRDILTDLRQPASEHYEQGRRNMARTLGTIEWAIGGRYNDMSDADRLEWIRCALAALTHYRENTDPIDPDVTAHRCGERFTGPTCNCIGTVHPIGEGPCLLNGWED